MLVTHSWLDGPMSWQHQNQNKPMGAYDPASNRSDSESPTPQTIRDCWGDAMAMGGTPVPGATFTAAPFFGGPPEAFGSALGGARAPSSAFSSTLSGGILPPLDMGFKCVVVRFKLRWPYHKLIMAQSEPVFRFANK